MLTRNETILPSTFQYYNKGSVGKTTGYGNHGTLEILGGKGDQNGALVLLPPTDHSENSIFLLLRNLLLVLLLEQRGLGHLEIILDLLIIHLFYGIHLILLI